MPNVAQAIANLTNRFNQFLENAKKVSELDPQVLLNPSSEVHVMVNGESQKLTIQQILDAFVEKTYKELISVGDISLDGEEISFTDIIWKIEDVQYTKTEAIDIPLSLTGNIRNDIFVGNNNGEIERIAGIESDSIAVTPQTPFDKVFITQVTVTDSAVEDPIPPVVGNLYIEKEIYSPQVYNGSGVINAIAMNAKKSVLQFTGTTTQFHSFQKNFDNWFDGQFIIIDNRQASTDILLKHNDATGNVPLWIPSLEDLLLKKGFKALMRFNKPLMRAEYVGAIGKDGTVTEVTGTDGVVISNGTTTPAISLGNITPDSVASAGTVTGSNLSGTNTGDNSPNTNANAYADSKVQDSISDGTTDKAPSQNAVFDALALKENKVDYLETTGFDFQFNTNTNVILAGIAQSGGTINNQPINPITLNRYVGAGCWAHLGSASANGGYTSYLASNRYLYVGSVIFMVLKPARLTNTFIRAGIQGAQATTPFVDAGNMVCVEIVGDQLTFKTNLTTTTSSSPITLVNTDWLFILIEVESSSKIKFRVKNTWGGADLMTPFEPNTNLPISIENANPLGIQERLVWSSFSPTADTGYISAMARISHFQKKPQFLNGY